jgi:hypothetical protein
LTVQNASAIDAVGVDKRTNEAVLTVIDHLEWDQLREHTALLAEKLNRYFGFIESGEVYGSYPDAAGRKLRIDVICRFEPSAAGIGFLEKASRVASEYECALSWRHVAGYHGNRHGPTPARGGFAAKGCGPVIFTLAVIEFVQYNQLAHA